MNNLLSIGVLPVVLTLSCFLLGQKLQKKLGSALINPIIIAVILVLLFLKCTGISPAAYQADLRVLSWLLTPATICLALPMYEQFQLLKKHLGAIAAGVAAGTAASLAVVFGFALVFSFSADLTVSLLPKSITTAIGVVLSEMAGGMPGVTTAVIIFTGIFGNILGPVFCRIFRITDPVAQGVAYGTAAHVIGTAKASELSPLTSAVSSLSLVVAGLLTSLILPLVTGLL